LPKNGVRLRMQKKKPLNRISRVASLYTARKGRLKWIAVFLTFSGMDYIPGKYMIESKCSVGKGAPMVLLIPHDFTKAEGKKMLRDIKFVTDTLAAFIELAPESLEPEADAQFLQVA
jgi:hypothetical protein